MGYWRQGTNAGMGQIFSKAQIDAEIVAQSAQVKQSPYRVKSDNGFGQPHQIGDHPLGLSFTHGGMMLDLAAGCEQNQKLDVPWNILAVDLPPQVVRETSGVNIDLYVKSALNWIFSKSLALRDDYDVAIVLTYAFGGYSGRRDAQGLLDSDFQLRLQRGEISTICVAAGNGYLEDIHANLTHKDVNEQTPLQLVVPAASMSSTFLQVWLDEGAVLQDAKDMPFTLNIGMPNGQTHQLKLNTNSQAELIMNNRLVARAYFTNDTPCHALPTAAGPARTLGRFVLAISPSAINDAIPVGRWNLWVDKCDLELPAWIERGDSIHGFPNNRKQARFEHKSHVRWQENGRANVDLGQNSVIRRTGTLNDAANAEDVIVVAAHRDTDGSSRIAHYSSAGDGFLRRIPDVGTIAEFSDARRNRIAIGTRGTAKKFVNGTSTAAAIAAREIVGIILAAIAAKKPIPDLKTSLTAMGAGGQIPQREGAGPIQYQNLRFAER